MINYGQHLVDEEDIEAVNAILRSSRLTQGPVAGQFERAVATKVNSPYAVACCNGTAALHLACLALDVGPGDLVWTSSISFVASANCALYCGADIDFVDIDPNTFNLSPGSLKQKLVQATKKNRLPKVLIVVHMGGEPCDMPAISNLCVEYGVRVIEDASHALGSQCHGDPTGSCRYSDITTFSFHPVKPITSGEGGMATTRYAELAETMALMASHGITRDPESMENLPEGPWYYEQIGLGFNYRLSDIHAALGLSQLSKLDYFTAQRQEISETYHRMLDPSLIQCQHTAAGNVSSRHLFLVRLLRASERKAEIFSAMLEQGINLQCHYIPIVNQPYYRRMGFKPEHYPHSQLYYAQTLSLPVYPGLSIEDVERIAGLINRLTA